jgi:hypothetical protein
MSKISDILDKLMKEDGTLSAEELANKALVLLIKDKSNFVASGGTYTRLNSLINPTGMSGTSIGTCCTVPLPKDNLKGPEMKKPCCKQEQLNLFDCCCDKKEKKTISEKKVQDILNNATKSFTTEEIFERFNNDFLGPFAKDLDKETASLIEEGHKATTQPIQVADKPELPKNKIKTILDVTKLLTKLEDLVAEYTEKETLAQDEFYRAIDNKTNIKAAKKNELEASRKLQLFSKAFDECMSILNDIRIAELPKEFLPEIDSIKTTYNDLFDETKFAAHVTKAKELTKQLHTTGHVGCVKRKSHVK